ncbi:hypothetical protein HYH03_001307 [Edaphochlamys debaryana]|uniref:Thioesterase domain-containing protein n=1 Tax=Edaphochlamys debaryana TaxID=47281 RepID=A0A836C553_9CHLO|nr:hypothetical protein HYH03_001307 [Edaphochlamys debaryana]|eukprot:KAG2500530.1 hypothetical protein HYH03_001307 [Edaphochlamys debaryana]
MASLVEMFEPWRDLPRQPEEPLDIDISLGAILSAAAGTVLESELAHRLSALVHRAPPPLASVPWLRDLETNPQNATVLDRAGLTRKGGLLPDDHLFKSMARNGLLRDNVVVWSPAHTLLPPVPVRPGSTANLSKSPSADSTDSAAARTAATVFNVYALAGDVCGHPGVVHGGLSSAIIDETFGYLLFLLAGAVEGAQASAPGDLEAVKGLALKTAMTAHLEVDFVKPLPNDSIVACVAQLERVEGRKVYFRAELLSRPHGVGAGVATVYSRGSALFVVPRG